jgi:hypothetical protein
MLFIKFHNVLHSLNYSDFEYVFWKFIVIESKVFIKNNIAELYSKFDEIKRFSLGNLQMIYKIKYNQNFYK